MWRITGFRPRVGTDPAYYVGLGSYPWRWMASVTALAWRMLNKDGRVDFQLV